MRGDLLQTPSGGGACPVAVRSERGGLGQRAAEPALRGLVRRAVIQAEAAAPSGNARRAVSEGTTAGRPALPRCTVRKAGTTVQAATRGTAPTAGSRAVLCARSGASRCSIGAQSIRPTMRSSRRLEPAPAGNSASAKAPLSDPMLTHRCLRPRRTGPGESAIAAINGASRRDLLRHFFLTARIASPHRSAQYPSMRLSVDSEAPALLLWPCA